MIRRLLATAVGLSLAAVVNIPAQADDAPEVDRARALLKMLVEEKYDEFSAAGTDLMKSKMTPAAVQQLWAGLEFKLGEYRAETGFEEIPAGDHKAVRLAADFERGKLKIRFVLDGESRLAGLWVDELTPAPQYQPPSYVDQTQFREETLAIGSADAALPATLTIPKTPARPPAVVLVHGSGPNDQDETVGANMPFRDLAWGLASDGVAVLRYEKRTYKYPRGKPADEITLDYEVIDDALAAARILFDRDDIDPARVYVLGHSLGAAVGPEIARREARLAGLILMAAPARPIVDLVDDQIDYLAKANAGDLGEDEDEIRKIHEAIEAIRAGRAGEVKDDLLGIPAAYWAHVNKVVPVDIAEKLTLRVMVIHGGRDYQVTRKDFAIWRERVGDKPNFTLKLYESLNHLMIAGSGPSLPAEYQQAGHVDEQLIHDVAEWVRASSAPVEKAKD